MKNSTAVVLSLCITSAASQAGAQSRIPLIVEKAVGITRYITYADLSLSSKQGQDVLFSRVHEAVMQVCPKDDEYGFSYDAQGCKDFAWRGARPQMHDAINFAKAGFRTAVMSIAVTGAK